jgi:class 3 adenylate cyclase
VVLTKRPVHIPDVRADPDYEWGAIHFRTLLSVPVLVEDDLVGVIGAARDEHHPVVDSEIDVLATFADQSAIAIANSKLFETVERQRAELARFLSPEVAALVSSEDGAALLAGHRAHISVLFLDLRGFTAFTRDAEPEEVIEVLGEYHAAAGELIGEYGGTVEHFAGDGIMVFFNDPVPLPQHELRAARLACAMRERIAELSAAWDRRGYRLGFGAGLDVGHATLGRIGFEGRYDYAALGTVANLASRLSDEAKPGQIVVSQRALAALDKHVEAEPLPELRLKGFERPVNAWSLQRVVDA